MAQLAAPIELLDQVVGKPDDWYLTDFDLGDDLLDAKENLIDPIQSFLNGAQRVDLRRGRGAPDAATAATSATCRPAATRPSGTRSPTRTPSAATAWPSSSRPPTTCAARSTTIVATNRADVVAAIEGRKAELLGSAYYANATPEAQQSVARSDRPDASPASASESQIALIREIGTSFEESDYPALLDLLAASPAGRRRRPTRRPPKQTVSIKTIPVPGVSGVLETEEDVDRTSPPSAARSSRP